MKTFANLSVQWHHDFDTDADDIIDGTHKGPIDTYIAPEGLGDGPVWVKIAETGYDATKKMWAVDMLKAQKGRWDIVIPPTLAPGDYLIRQEVVALHQASVPWNGMTGSSTAQGVQLYMGCVQITVATGGTTVSFPFLPKDHGKNKSPITNEMSRLFQQA